MIFKGWQQPIGGGFNSYDLALDFKNGNYRSGSTTTNNITQLPGYSYFRTGQKYENNGNGVLVPFAENVPAIIPGIGYWARLSYQNLIQNSTFSGAVVGSSPPRTRGWPQSYAGITMAVVGVGSSEGIPYIDIQVSGVATLNGSMSAVLAPGGQDPAAVEGETFTISGTAELVAGSVNGVQSASFRVEMRNSSGVGLSSNQAVFAFDNVLFPNRRPSATLTAPANTAFAVPIIRFGWVADAVIDATFRISAPSLVKSSIAGPYIPTSDGPATIALDNLRLSQPMPQDEDWIYVVKANYPQVAFSAAEVVRLSGPNGNVMYLNRYAGGGASFVVQKDGTTISNLGQINFSPNPGKVTIVGRRQGQRYSFRAMREDGVLSNQFTTASDVGLPSNLNTMQIGANAGMDAPIEFVGFKRGTFNDSDIINMLQSV